MPPCVFASFRQVLEAGHPFVPQHPDVVEGLHLPGARPIRRLDDGVLANDPTTERARAHANAGGGAAQVQLLAQGPVANLQANQIPNAHANAPGVGVMIMEKVSALVTTFRRLGPVLLVERWLRRAVRDQ